MRPDRLLYTGVQRAYGLTYIAAGILDQPFGGLDDALGGGPLQRLGLKCLRDGVEACTCIVSDRGVVSTEICKSANMI